MSNIILFKNSSEGIPSPMHVKGDIYGHTVIIKTDDGDRKFRSDVDLRPYLFGDCLLAYLSLPDEIIPIRRTEQYAVRNPTILNQINAWKSGLERINKQMKDTLTVINKMTKGGNQIDYEAILQEVSKIENFKIESNLKDIINPDIATVNLIQSKKYQKPIYWRMKLKLGVKSITENAYVDTGSPISIVDENILSPEILRNASNSDSKIRIEGLTGGYQICPYIPLKFSIKGKSDEIKFAVMPGLNKKLGRNILIGQDIFNAFSGGRI